MRIRADSIDVRGTTWNVGLITIGIKDRPILDKTGLDGQFDIALEWSPAQFFNEPGGLSVSGERRPPLPVALQEQLGLKLESTQASIDVLVVENISLPDVD